MPKAEQSLNELLHELRRVAKSREVLTERKVKSIYGQLLKDLKSFIGDEYIRYADADGRLFTAALQKNTRMAKFLEEIARRIDSIAPDVKKEMSALIEEVYRLSYIGMADAVKKAADFDELYSVVGDMTVRPEVLNRAVKNNISRLTLSPVLEKARQEIIYDIQQTLTIGLINGDRYETIAKRISERIDVSRGKAENIARTETHWNIEAGLLDCAEEIQTYADRSGYIYSATWRTMKDSKVRPQKRVYTKKGWKTRISRNGANHQKMEGKIVIAGEPFDLGDGVKAKAPGQSGVAAHDCRCRCFLEYDLLTEEEFLQKGGVLLDEYKEKQLKKAKYNGIIKKESFNSKDDPMFEVMGAARISHPKELAKMKKQLSEWGVEINYNSHNLGYGCTRMGEPGKLSINDDASYSAWLHEFQHVKDDREHGWNGAYVLWCDPDERIRREQAAYAVEINFAREFGYEDIARRLEDNLNEEIRKIKNKYNTK